MLLHEKANGPYCCNKTLEISFHTIYWAVFNKCISAHTCIMIPTMLLNFDNFWVHQFYQYFIPLSANQ